MNKKLSYKLRTKQAFIYIKEHKDPISHLEEYKEGVEYPLNTKLRYRGVIIQVVEEEGYIEGCACLGCYMNCGRYGTHKCSCVVRKDQRGIIFKLVN